MGKYVIDEMTLTAIGDSIRSKEETAEAVPVTQMAARISALKDPQLKAVVEGNIKEISDDTITRVAAHAFRENYVLKTVHLPEATFIGGQGFLDCTALQEVYLPKVTSAGSQAFEGCTALTALSLPNVTTGATYLVRDCSKLETVELPKMTSVQTQTFSGCTSLKTVSVPVAKSIASAAFKNCTSLEWVDFSGCTEVATLSNTNAFSTVPTTCEIRVPAALLEEWKAAANWSTYASQIVGV